MRECIMCSSLLTKWRLLLPFSGGHRKPNYDHSVRSALFHVHGTVSLQLVHEMASFELFLSKWLRQPCCGPQSCARRRVQNVVL
jgi:hypothetical protein